MRKIALFTVMVFMLAFAAFDVAALSGAAAELTLGSDSTRASNPNADDVADRNSNVQATFVITNNEAAAISNLAAVFTPKSPYTTADLNLSVTFDRTSLNPTETATATITGRITEKLDAVSSVASGLDEIAISVATVQFTATGGAPASADVKMQRENQLVIDSAEVCINDEDNCENTDNDGDNVDGVRPGDELIIKIEAKNKYSDSDSEDIAIDSGDGKIEFEIDDADLDESEEEDLEIDPEDTQEESWRLQLDDDVEDGKYELVLRAYGDDDFGALHGEEIKIDLEIERKSHEVDIRSFSVSPATLSCNDLSTTVRARLTNIGKKDEDNAAFEVISNELGVRERADNLNIDEGRSTDVARIVRINDNIKAGNYRLSLRSYFEGTAQSDEESVEITVPDCSDVKADEEDEKPTSTQETELEAQLRAFREAQAARTQPRVTTTPTTSVNTATGVTSDVPTIIAMGAGALLLLAVLVFMIVKVFRR